MIILAAIILFASLIVAHFNGRVGKLPVMGYDTYNAFGSDYNGSPALKKITAMKSLEIKDFGYNTALSTSHWPGQFTILTGKISSSWTTSNTRLAVSSTRELEGNKTKLPHRIANWTT